MDRLKAQTILESIPHRYPVLMVDRVTLIEEGVSGIGCKNVTINDFGLQGHFPEYPIMPAPMVMECMAQTAAIILASPERGNRTRGASDQPKYLAKIDDMKFHKMVVPGDQLVIHVKLLKRFGRAVQIFAEAQVNQCLVASGRLTFVASS